jgi:hypothetical protein
MRQVGRIARYHARRKAEAGNELGNALVLVEEGFDRFVDGVGMKAEMQIGNCFDD